jgi:hypothetical protein
LALVGLAALSAVAVACGDDDDSGKTPTAAAQSQDQKDVQAVIDKINTSLQNKDIDGLLAGFTDNGVKAIFLSSKDDIKAHPEDLQATPFTAGTITVSGTKASVTGTTNDPSNGFDSPQVVNLVKGAGGWQVDGMESVNAKAPSGAKTVNIGMKEFEFDFTPSDIPSGKPILFHLKNTGAQAHFMDLAKIPADAKIDDLLNYQGDGPPPGVTDIGSSNPVAPGKEVDVAFNGKLDAGRYVLLCFMPDTDGTPHAFKGMVADFTIK